MPVEHVVSLEYLICFIVLHCVLAAFCQLLLNEYCIVLYCIVQCKPEPMTKENKHCSYVFNQPAVDGNMLRRCVCVCGNGRLAAVWVWCVRPPVLIATPWSSD